MQPHELVKEVHEAYPKLPHKAAIITGKSDEIFRSHHREPRTRNPLQSGNVSPVTAFVEYVHLYEAAAPGAGMMLVNRCHSSLIAEFTDCDINEDVLHEELIDEGGDVQKWLVRCDIDTATARELTLFEFEVQENIDKLQELLAKARARKRIVEAGVCNVRSIGRDLVAARRAK